MRFPGENSSRDSFPTCQRSACLGALSRQLLIHAGRFTWQNRWSPLLFPVSGDNSDEAVKQLQRSDFLSQHRVGQEPCGSFPPSEPYKRLSPHTAQALQTPFGYEGNGRSLDFTMVDLSMAVGMQQSQILDSVVAVVAVDMVEVVLFFTLYRLFADHANAIRPF